MRNTYINDNSLVNYPFADGAALPFPRDLITGLSVCIFQKTAAAVASVEATGLEIGENGVTLALSVNGDTLIGRLTARIGGSAELAVDNALFRAYMFMQTGTCSGTPYMSVPCLLPLDPSCVVVMTGDCLGRIPHVYVSGDKVPVGEKLDLVFGGSLSASDFIEPEASDAIGHTGLADALTVTVEGWAGEDDVTTVAGTLAGYDMVTSINGVPVIGDSQGSVRLNLEVVPLDDEPSGTDTRNRMAFGMWNGVKDSQLTADPDDAGADVVPYGFNDMVGNSTIVSVIGGPEIPNCYGSDDESGDPDAGDSDASAT